MKRLVFIGLMVSLACGAKILNSELLMNKGINGVSVFDFHVIRKLWLFLEVSIRFDWSI